MNRPLPRSVASASDNVKVNDKKIIILTKNGMGNKKKLTNSLKEECDLQAEFVSDLEKLIPHLVSSKSRYFIHDWDAFDEQENYKLHQQISGIQTLQHLCRVICAEEMSTKIYSLAGELRINRLVTKAAFKLNTGNEINNVKNTYQNTNPILKELIGIQNGNIVYSQERIDKIVKACYIDYPHELTVKVEYANLCYRKEEYSDTLKLVEEILNNDSHHVRALTLKAKVFSKQDMFVEATELLQKADFLSPQNSDRLILIGDIFYKRKKTKKAREYYHKAIESSKGTSFIEDNIKNERAVEKLTTFEIQQDNMIGAVDFFQNCLSEDEIAGTFNNIGIAAVKSSRHRDAIRLYEIAESSLQTNKYRHMVCFNIGLAYKYLNNFEKSLLYFETALKIKPDYEKALRQKHIILQMTREEMI